MKRSPLNLALILVAVLAASAVVTSVVIARNAKPNTKKFSVAQVRRAFGAEGIALRAGDPPLSPRLPHTLFARKFKLYVMVWPSLRDLKEVRKMNPTDPVPAYDRTFGNVEVDAPAGDHAAQQAADRGLRRLIAQS
jgi:hypothetical protein